MLTKKVLYFAGKSIAGKFAYKVEIEKFILEQYHVPEFFAKCKTSVLKTESNPLKQNRDLRADHTLTTYFLLLVNINGKNLTFFISDKETIVTPFQFNESLFDGTLFSGHISDGAFIINELLLLKRERVPLPCIKMQSKIAHILKTQFKPSIMDIVAIKMKDHTLL